MERLANRKKRVKISIIRLSDFVILLFDNKDQHQNIDKLQLSRIYSLYKTLIVYFIDFIWRLNDKIGKIV